MKLAQLALVAFVVAAFQAAGADREVSFDRTLTVSGAADVQVETGSGSIEVRPGDGSAVRIHGRIRANAEAWQGDDSRIRDLEAHPPITQEGNRIHISLPTDEWLRHHISISYALEVPAATRLRASTGSGRESVEGIRGPVEVQTGSGGIGVMHIEEAVHAETGSGRIELQDLKAKVEASTGSGSIEGSGITGPINAHTGSGSVRLEQTVGGPLEAHTGSGSVNVRLPSGAAFDLYAHTGSGRVYVDHPVAVQGALAGHEIQGKVNGGGPAVNVSTGSGSVRIE